MGNVALDDAARATLRSHRAALLSSARNGNALSRLLFTRTEDVMLIVSFAEPQDS